MPKEIRKVLSRLGIKKINFSFKSVLQQGLPLVVLLVMTGFGIFWVHQSLEAARIMELKGVRLVGLKQLTASEVIKMTGIKKGVDLFNLKLDEVSEPLLAHPRIRSVSVKKIYPNDLEISLIERKPVVQIFVPQTKSYHLIDEEGVLLPDTGSEPFDNYFVYSDEEVKMIPEKVGKMYGSHYLEILLAAQSQIQSELDISGETIHKIYVDRLGFWSFITNDEIEFRIGDDFSNLQKMESVKPLLKEGVRDKVSYMDLRFQDVIVKNKSK
jgi:cell division septal protein FtsQ